ncbi:MAG: hypothetical protein WCO26_22485, partial [Deltaproteobacteria bacterium]
MKRIVDVVAIFSSLFVIFTVSTRYFGGMESLGVYIACVLVLTFLSKPLSKTHEILKWVDYLLSVASVVIGLYSFFFAEEIANTIGDSPPLYIFLGAVAIILVLEATRRLAGLVIV